MEKRRKRRAFQKKKLFKLHKMLLVKGPQMGVAPCQRHQYWMLQLPRKTLWSLLAERTVNGVGVLPTVGKPTRTAPITQKMSQVLVENYSSSFVLI